MKIYIAITGALLELSSGAFTLGLVLLVQSTVLILAGLFVARAVRARGPALRSTVLRATLVSVLFCPLATLVWTRAGVRGVAMPSPTKRETDRTIQLGYARGTVPRAITRTRAAAVQTPIVRVDSGGDRDRPPPPDTEPATLLAPAAPERTSANSSTSRIAATLATLWVVGTALLLLRLAIAHLRMRRIRRRAQPAPEALRATCEDAAREIGARVPCLLSSGDICNPCLHGLLRAAILLPRSADGTTSGSRDVLVHELAHLVRRDCAWNLAAHLARAVIFFQPLIWILTRRLEEVSDDVADGFVIDHGADRRRYARELVDYAERLRAIPFHESVAGVGAVSFKTSLGQRVQRILETTVVSIRTSPRAVAATAALGLGVTLCASLIGAAGEPVASGAVAPPSPTTTAVAPPGPAPAAQAAGPEKTLADIAPPFTFRIHTRTRDGGPQSGVNVRCLHPRSERGAALVDQVATSDADGVARFEITKAQLVTDRYFWFSLADDQFVGSYGVGISPVDEEFEYTFTVAPTEEFVFQVTDERGEEVPGAKVQLMAHGESAAGTGPSAFHAHASATADDSGVARIRFVPGKTQIVASAKGYAPTLQSEETLSGTELHELRLGPGRTLRGEITDEQGRPVEGVEITAKRKDFALAYMEEFVLRGTSDADGRFELPGAAAAGAYIVEANATSRALIIASVTIEGTPESENRVAMQARTGAILKGRYVTSHKLRLSDRTIFVSTSGSGQRPSQRSTDADGQFVLAVPTNGSGSVNFIGVSGFYTDVRVPEELRFLSAREQRVRFEGVPEGLHDGIEVHFLLAGRAHGVLRDDGGQPLSGLRIVVSPGGRIFETTQDGSFNVEVPPKRQVTLEVRDPSTNATLYRTEPFDVGEGELLERDVTIPNRKALAARRELDSEVTGRVVLRDGTPVSGATVYLGNSGLVPQELHYTGDLARSPVKPAWKKYGPHRPAQLETAEDGTFVFDALFQGTTDLWAHHPEHGWGWLRGVHSGSAEPAVIVLEPETRSVRFAGRILDEKGTPVPGTFVRLYTAGSRGELLANTKSDEAGRFALDATPPWAPFQHLELLCTTAGGELAWKVLPRCSAEGLDLRIARGAAITGRVRNGRREPVEGGVVRLYSVTDQDRGIAYFWGAKAEAAPSTHTDENGDFTLKGVPAGSTVALIADHDDYAQQHSWNIVVEDEPTRIADIALPDGVTIEGTVSYSDSREPASGVVVTCAVYSDVKTVTDDQGGYRFRGLEPRMGMTEVGAQDNESTPEWSGSTAIEEKLREGARVTGVDIVLKPTIGHRQKRWRQTRGKPIRSRSRIAVLDDADPVFRGKTKYADTVSLVSSTGEVIWKLEGINTFQSVGAHHRVVAGPRGETLWVATGNELLKFRGDGELAFRNSTLPARALAADTKSDRVWVLVGGETIYDAHVQVLDQGGNAIARHEIPGYDLAPTTGDGFWVVGKRVRRVDRDGEIRYEWAEELAWTAVSVAVSEADGSAWVVERRHPDVWGSHNRLIIFEADGAVRRAIQLDAHTLGAIAIDDRRQCAWLAVSDGLLRLTPRGEITTTVPVNASSLAVEPDTGYVWAASMDGVYRLDRQGHFVWHMPSKKESRKWIAVLAAGK